MSDEKKDGDQSPKLTVVEGGKESPASKRRKLTSKQESFLAGLIRGKTQYEAYCNAYDAGGMKRSAIDNEAWRLAGHHEISRRLQAHHASIERAASASAGSRRRLVLERLERLERLLDGPEEGIAFSHRRAVVSHGRQSRSFLLPDSSLFDDSIVRASTTPTN